MVAKSGFGSLLGANCKRGGLANGTSLFLRSVYAFDEEIQSFTDLFTLHLGMMNTDLSFPPTTCCTAISDRDFFGSVVRVNNIHHGS